MKTLHRITKNRAFTHVRALAAVLLVLSAVALMFIATSAPAARQASRPKPLTPRFFTAVAFDVSPALRSLPHSARPLLVPPGTILEVRPEGRRSESLRANRIRAHRPDGALQRFNLTPTIPDPLLTFEGMSNQDNFNIFGGRVNPPDTIGDVGPNHYVEMINLVYAIWDKSGNLLMGPVDTGSLWAGFPIEDCTDPSGDPVVTVRSDYRPLDPKSVHDARTRRSIATLLQLCRCFADRRPDWRLLPVCFHHSS